MEGSGMYRNTTYREAFNRNLGDRTVRPELETGPPPTLKPGAGGHPLPHSSHDDHYRHWNQEDGALCRGVPDRKYDSLLVPGAYRKPEEKEENVDKGSSPDEVKSAPSCMLSPGVDGTQKNLAAFQDLFQLGPPTSKVGSALPATQDHVHVGSKTVPFRGVTSYALDFPSHRPPPHRSLHGPSHHPIFDHPTPMFLSTTHKEHFTFPPPEFRPVKSIQGGQEVSSLRISGSQPHSQMQDVTQTMLDFREVPLPEPSHSGKPWQKAFEPPLLRMQSKSETGMAYVKRHLPPKTQAKSVTVHHQPAVTPLSGKMKDATLYKLDFGERPQ